MSTKTAKEQVRDAHPLSECHPYGSGYDVTELAENPKDDLVELGYGETRQKAWANAAKRLEERK